MARNNETTTKFKVDISELKSAMQEARKQVAYANSEFKAVSSSLDDWSKSSEGLNAKLKQLKSNLDSQEAVLSEYEGELERIKKEYGENSKEALEYGKILNDQRATVNYIQKDISKYQDALKEVSEAEKIASKTGKDVAEVLDDLGKEAEDAEGGFTILKGAVAEFVGNALTKLVEGLRDGIASLVTFGDEADKALNSFQASTGATAEEMAKFEDTMNNIYKANYGESFEDIATAMGEVKRVAGDIGANELEKMTTNAIVLRDTFDFEVSESMRAVNSLMDQFGLTSDQAFNLMAQGAQKGLNQNGDLLDVINEYSVQFKSAGYSADEMFNMLANGAESGTWSVDKLGDAVKEFNIRMSDGSAKDAVEALGFSWDSVREGWAKGGDEAKDVFNTLINELDGLERTTDGYSIGVGLLGTMYEDLGQDAILALSQIDGEFSSTKATMEEINAVRYDSVGDALQGIGRNLQTGILMPISEKILPIVSDLATKFNEWLNDPATQQAITDLTDKISQFVDDGLNAITEGVKWFLDNKDAVIAGLAGIATGFVAFNVASTIMAVVNAFKAFKLANEGATVAQWLLNTAMNANPIVLIVTLVATLVGALITFIATNDEARAKFLEIWGKIVEGAKEFISNAITYIQELPAKISEWLTNTKDKITQWVTDMVTKAKEMGSQFINNVVEFFSTLPTKVHEWITNVIMKVTKWVTDMINKAKEVGREFIQSIVTFFSTLPTKIAEFLTNVITKVTTWVTNMVEKAKEAGQKFVEKVIEKASELKDKIWTELTNVITKVTTFATDLGNKAKEAGQKLLDGIMNKASELKDKIKTIGTDVVTGLWNGINDKVQWLKDKVSGFVGNVTSWLKEFFKIGSPSKLMADEIGKWLPEGIAVGITDNAKSAINAMRDLAIDTVGGAKSGLTSATTGLGGSAVTGGGVVNNFTQVINSPKQLNRLDIYRQSKNLLGFAGGGV